MAQDQRFSFGITGGVPFERSGQANVDNHHYAFGLDFEAYLNEHVSLDFNPLYKRTTSQQSFLGQTGLTSVQTTQVQENYSIDMPVMGRYTFKSSSDRWRPFAGAGFAFQTAWQDNKSTTSILSPTTPTQTQTSNTGNTWARYDVGAVFGIGVRVKVGRFQVVPEIRYTRWGGANETHARNQPEVLFTFKF